MSDYEYIDIRALEAEADYYDQLAQEQATQRAISGETVSVYKAVDTDHPDVTITIAEPVSDLWQPGKVQLNLDAYAQLYDTDAQRIVDALVRTLPGGTLDRVIAKLLMVKASHFVVAHDYEVKSE